MQRGSKIQDTASSRKKKKNCNSKTRYMIYTLLSLLQLQHQNHNYIYNVQQFTCEYIRYNPQDNATK